MKFDTNPSEYAVGAVIGVFLAIALLFTAGFRQPEAKLPMRCQMVPA